MATRTDPTAGETSGALFRALRSVGVEPDPAARGKSHAGGVTRPLVRLRNAWPPQERGAELIAQPSRNGA